VIEKPFKQEQKEGLGIQKRDQRCYFKESSIRIYSRGGSEFVVPMVFQVEDVFPIENGIIVKLRYDRDKLVFDAS
jgi:Anaphase-promoting complex subunit 1